MFSKSSLFKIEYSINIETQCLKIYNYILSHIFTFSLGKRVHYQCYQNPPTTALFSRWGSPVGDFFLPVLFLKTNQTYIKGVGQALSQCKWYILPPLQIAIILNLGCTDLDVIILTLQEAESSPVCTIVLWTMLYM